MPSFLEENGILSFNMLLIMLINKYQIELLNSIL